MNFPVEKYDLKLKIEAYFQKYTLKRKSCRKYCLQDDKREFNFLLQYVTFIEFWLNLKTVSIFCCSEI